MISLSVLEECQDCSNFLPAVNSIETTCYGDEFPKFIHTGLKPERLVRKSIRAIVIKILLKSKAWKWLSIIIRAIEIMICVRSAVRLLRGL